MPVARLALLLLVLLGCASPRVMLDVPHTYDGCGTLCWLGAFHMVLQRPDLRYEVLVLHSNPVELDTGSPLLGPVAQALGYRIYVDGTSAEEMRRYARRLGDAGGVGEHLAQPVEELERRLRAGEPVMVHVSLDELGGAPPGALHYLAMVGFDGEAFYAHDPVSDRPESRNRRIPRATFEAAWAATGHKIFRPVRTGDPVPPQEALAALRTQAPKSAARLAEIAGHLREDGTMQEHWLQLSTGAYRREVLARWLDRFQEPEAAAAYRQAATLYRTLDAFGEPRSSAATVARIAEIEAKAAASLSGSSKPAH